MATLSEEYQNYFAIDIDKAGLVPAYHIPPSVQQTQPIPTMPMSTDKTMGLVGKSTHFSPVPLTTTFWQEPNTETRLQCLDHLAAAAAGIKISPNVYSSHNPMTSSSPGLSSMQPVSASYNQNVLEKMYFQHQQDKMQLQYQQRQLAAQEEQKVSLLNSGHPAVSAAVSVPQINLFPTPARPSPRLPITQYLYNMYGSKYRYANPVVIQQYPTVPNCQEQWIQPINGIQKSMEGGTFDKTIRDRNNPTNVGLQSPYKSANEMVIPVNPTPKHPSSLLTQAQSSLTPSDTIETIDIDKLSPIGMASTSTNAACGGPQNTCLNSETCLPCTEANKLLYNFCKSTSTQNSQKGKDAGSDNFNNNTNNSSRSAVKNNDTESSNCCNSNANSNGNNKNNTLSMSRPGLSGDYPGSYPSMHPNPWPSSTQTSSSSPLYTTQLPTQTTFPLPASSPTAPYYPYANMRNELGDPRNAIYNYGIEDPMTRMTRPRGIFSTRYHPFDRERRI